MITPTNGRVVWFTPDATFAGAWLDKTRPLMAHVCHTFGETVVNLDVVDSNGTHFAMHAVQFVQTDEERAGVAERGRFAEWMPYQKGQAAKTEALEAKSAAPA